MMVVNAVSSTRGYCKPGMVIMGSQVNSSDR